MKDQRTDLVVAKINALQAVVVAVIGAVAGVGTTLVATGQFSRDREDHTSATSLERQIDSLRTVVPAVSDSLRYAQESLGSLDSVAYDSVEVFLDDTALHLSPGQDPIMHGAELSAVLMYEGVPVTWETRSTGWGDEVITFRLGPSAPYVNCASLVVQLSARWPEDVTPGDNEWQVGSILPPVPSIFGRPGPWWF